MKDLLNISILEKEISKSRSSFENDILQESYDIYINSLSTRQIDRNFNESLKILSKSLDKLSPEDRKFMIDVLANVIGQYLENKIEREIKFSFEKILKL